MNGTDFLFLTILAGIAFGMLSKYGRLKVDTLADAFFKAVCLAGGSALTVLMLFSLFTIALREAGVCIS